MSCLTLLKRLSADALMSRRAAELAIRDARVTVNGALHCEPADRVADTDAVALDGKPLRRRNTPLRYYLLNKPEGYACTCGDRHAERLALELLPREEGVRLFPVGRLDQNSCGLIIFTNDGNFMQRMIHPKYGVKKRYRVETSPALPEEAAAKFTRGIEDGGETLRALSVKPLSDGVYEFVLQEGRKREIRRMVASTGCRTVLLRRLSEGEIELGDLPEGKFRHLTASEIQSGTMD